jgi:PadR family transcriptional regulator PadR
VYLTDTYSGVGMDKVSFENKSPLVREKNQLVVFLRLMSEGPIYGYDLASRFKKLTRGHMKVSYGTVYPFLRRMESRGLAVSAKDKSTRRVYYTLTQKGKLTLKQLLGRFQESKQSFDETLLGFLAIYSELFGHKALKELLRRAQPSRVTTK